nr:hypothetical protein [Tanacetum cinerariifolium]
TLPSFQRSQIHNIKLSMSNHCLGRFLYNQDYPSQEVVDQSRMSRHKIKSIIHKKYLEDRDLDIGGDQKLETSTLGEIVSLEKSNKNKWVPRSLMITFGVPNWENKDFKNLTTTRALLVGSALASTHLDK